MTKAEQLAEEYAANKYYKFIDGRDQVVCAYLAGYEQGQKDLIEALKAETDPESWGALALPKVLEIMEKLQGGE